MTDADKTAFFERCILIGQGAKVMLEASQVPTADWVPFTQNIELVCHAMTLAQSECYPIDNPRTCSSR